MTVPPELIQQIHDMHGTGCPPHHSKRPNRWLTDMSAKLEPGSALVLGVGQGRNPVSLASGGWSVTAIDLSEKAIERTKTRAAEANCSVACMIGEATSYDYGGKQFDLITSIYFNVLRVMIHKLPSLLKSGGILIAEAYGPNGHHPDDFQFGELSRLIEQSGLSICRFHETMDVVDWGLTYKRVVRLVAEKRQGPLRNWYS